MDKERFVEIIKEGTFTEAHLEELDALVDKYPWFALPRFLRLKVTEQLGQKPEAHELSQTAVFSSDRKHLYKWIKGTFGSMIETSGFSSTELEFLDSEEGDTSAETDETDSFFLLDEEDEAVENDDADASPIPEKDESEMEEPELEAPEAVPVIDPLDDDEEDEENDVPVDEEVTPDNSPGEEEQVQPPSARSNNLIKRFLESEAGVIKADQQTNLEGDVSEGSVKEDDSFITDTLAKIYVKQGLHAKAIYAYERLSLKYPEKSAYFAAQIEKIKNNSNV